MGFCFSIPIMYGVLGQPYSRWLKGRPQLRRLGTKSRMDTAPSAECSVSAAHAAWGMPRPREIEPPRPPRGEKVPRPPSLGNVPRPRMLPRLLKPP